MSKDLEVLKPCPFCGATEHVHLYQQKKHLVGTSFWVAHCKTCNITRERLRRSETITAWNTRQAADQLERYRVALEAARTWLVVCDDRRSDKALRLVESALEAK